MPYSFPGRYKVIVATPHSLDGNHTTDPELIRRMVKDLNQALQAKGVDVKILREWRPV